MHDLPDANRQAKGIPIINLPGWWLSQGEFVSAIITLPQFEPDHYMAMATGGMIKKTSWPSTPSPQRWPPCNRLVENIAGWA